MSEFLPIAVRAHTETNRKNRCAAPHSSRARSGWRLPDRVLVFDCESEIDAGQALTFGSYRYCRFVAGQLEVLEEGLFHADDLGARNPDGLAVLNAYAKERGLRMHSRREFVKRVFWRCAYRGRAWVVGFNLPFDLARLAVAFGAARGANAGGHSLVFWDYASPDGARLEDRYRPRVLIKSLDRKRAFISFGHRREPDPDDQIPEESVDGQPELSFRFKGHFLDLRTLAFALTNKSHSLASACEAFGVEQGKLAVEQHGVITAEYVDYNRRDVSATASLLERLLAEYRRHPIQLAPTKAYSPASIAKAYLRAMQVAPLLDRQPDFSRKVLGAGMVAYYGGRSECRIRRTSVPVVYVDFLSMYATVNTLMGAWRLVTADRIEPTDVTDAIRELLESVKLERCFDLGLWPRLLALVQVELDGELLPVRADYNENGQWQIGKHPLTNDVPLWYPLADVIAAVLRSGRAPRIVRAIQLDPVGQQSELRPIRLGAGVEIDPASDDFFATVVEQRRQLSGGTNLDRLELERLRAFLKVLANSGCYGIFAEINGADLGKSSKPVTIYGLHRPFTQRLRTVENPGSYSFPPLAACITAAARLMLALVEQLVADAGGSYVFCDTDSMAIVATPAGGLVLCRGGELETPDGQPAIRALSYAEVDGVIQRFTALNPYNPELVNGSILELEEWNFDEETGERRQLYCYAISAKRYALYNLSEDDRPLLRKPSEHGLGHLLNPTDPDSDDRDWIWQAWEQILDDALDRRRENR